MNCDPAATVLSVDNLVVDIRTGTGTLKVLRGLSWSLRKGETLAILGESGSGKSVSAQAILGLLPTDVATIRNGAIEYESRELIGLSEREMRRIRGREMALIYQDALSSLNPVATVGRQISEMFIFHGNLSRRQARIRTIELLKLVHIPSPEKRYDNYPHQFSGGMRQRVMIAMSLAMNPRILIADEPTTALDVTVQAEIMELLRDIQRRLEMSIVLITHDLAVVAESADRICVMYAGRVVESGPTAEVLSRSAHPYTRGLLDSLPSSDTTGNLKAIKGQPLDLRLVPNGCPFANRCPYVQEVCLNSFPEMRAVSPVHRSACHFAEAQVSISTRSREE